MNCWHPVPRAIYSVLGRCTWALVCNLHTWKPAHLPRFTEGFLVLCAGVSLEVPPNLPSGPVLSRWLGQPLKALLLPTACFTTNKRGYPVLGKQHQDLTNTAMTYGVQVCGGGHVLGMVQGTWREL